MTTVPSTRPTPGVTINRKAYRPAEVAAMLGLDVETVRRALGRGDMPGRRLWRNGPWLTPADELDQWLASRRERGHDDDGEGSTRGEPV